ncbi:MAG: hypothetical protein ING44_01445 [Telmatospirillum sp.]|nr:hypothetical protein [Telmatospirillum sp.]
MRRFPKEFSELLKPHVAPRGDAPFFATSDLIAPAMAASAFALLERHLAPALKPLARAIPPETIANQTRNYQERLPKTVRNRAADIDGTRSKAAKLAAEIGLARMLSSPSYFAFAQMLAGRKLDPAFGRQVLRYGPGDYAGPHTDHHPEEPRARDGYFDLHISFANKAAKRQLLIYAQEGHLDRAVDVAGPATIAAYRLPFWHYTTPLEGGRDAARWVILGTFLYA